MVKKFSKIIENTSNDRAVFWRGMNAKTRLLLDESTRKNAARAAIFYDKFHVMWHLGEVLDKVQKQESARFSGGDRKYIK